jgi:hypothetical protein
MASEDLNFIRSRSEFQEEKSSKEKTDNRTRPELFYSGLVVLVQDPITM